MLPKLEAIREFADVSQVTTPVPVISRFTFPPPELDIPTLGVEVVVEAIVKAESDADELSTIKADTVAVDGKFIVLLYPARSRVIPQDVFVIEEIIPFLKPSVTPSLIVPAADTA